MAQECGSAGTPLPVVGCEVEFTPDQHYKVMRSGKNYSCDVLVLFSNVLSKAQSVAS